MDDLVKFLRARFDEREQNAACIHDTGCMEVRWDGLCDCGEPERVRREVEAKRRIMALHDRKHHQCVAEDGPTQWHAKDPCATLRLLVLPEADHPDYRQEWALTPA
jgi:hypothetical protein